VVPETKRLQSRWHRPWHLNDLRDGRLTPVPVRQVGGRGSHSYTFQLNLSRF